MSHVHAFGILLAQFRSRLPGLTQARVATLAGYDPAVITRMSKGQQDLIGPQARTRVLRVIQALDQAGVLHGLDDANALLAAANLSPLIEAKDAEAILIQRMHRHSTLRSTTQLSNAPVDVPAYVGRLIQEYGRIWDKATDDGERISVLASAAELALRYGQPALGMRLLACAARDVDTVLETACIVDGAFSQQIRDARAKLEYAEYTNAWIAGQMLTLDEARAWLGVLPKLISPRKESR